MAEVLLGVTNPSGKLQYRYPQYENDQLPYFDPFPDLIAPLYLSSPSLPISFDLSLSVSVCLSNCGPRDGAEAVLLVRTLSSFCFC